MTPKGAASVDRKEVERHLYLYPAYKATITDLRRQYSQSARPEFGMAIQAGEVSDPTYGAVSRLHSDPEYLKAYMFTRAIDTVMGLLDDQTCQAVEEVYFKGQNRTMEGVAARCAVDPRQLYRLRMRALDYMQPILYLSGVGVRILSEMCPK